MPDPTSPPSRSRAHLFGCTERVLLLAARHLRETWLVLLRVSGFPVSPHAACRRRTRAPRRAAAFRVLSDGPARRVEGTRHPPTRRFLRPRRRLDAPRRGILDPLQWNSHHTHHRSSPDAVAGTARLQARLRPGTRSWLARLLSLCRLLHRAHPFQPPPARSVSTAG